MKLQIEREYLSFTSHVAATDARAMPQVRKMEAMHVQMRKMKIPHPSLSASVTLLHCLFASTYQQVMPVVMLATAAEQGRCLFRTVKLLFFHFGHRHYTVEYHSRATVVSCR